MEILARSDRGEESVGSKRNRLVAASGGEYVCFVDDDDEVSPRYVELLYGAVAAEPAVDCVGINGTITFRGRHPRPFEHSRRNEGYSSTGGVYRRPPYHLNPVRRSIALEYPFAEVDYSEDIDWALRLARDGALKTERFVDEPVYVYRSRRHYAYMWALDRTERVRHALGLTMANRLRARRAVLGGDR